MRTTSRIPAALAFAAGVYSGVRLVTRWRRRVEFRGASAVITGASRGLGLILARELAREGARLTLIARNAAELERARGDLEERGAQEVLVLPCDAGDRAAVEAAVDEVVRRRGRIDLLINNAGVIQVGPIDHMTVGDFEEAMRVHFWAPLYASLAAIRHMDRQGGGRIVNISSVGGKVAVPHLAPYAASKFALTGLSDALRAELSRRRIFVTTVAPGLMRTGSHVNVGLKGRHREEFAWFAAGAGAPGVSMNARRAARRILKAARYGRRALDLGLPARILIIADALVPSLVGEAMALVSAALPEPRAAGGDESQTGWESRSRWAPSLLTRRADRAVEEHGELRGHRPEELRRKAGS